MSWATHFVVSHIPKFPPDVGGWKKGSDNEIMDIFNYLYKLLI